MKEFLQTIFKSTEDRIKNPFIGAFLTSWVLFNWKPILYLAFSDEKIKDKIDFIIDTEKYNNIWNYFWLPLFSAIFYIGVLPYVSLVFEFIVKFSHKWRNNISLEARDEALQLQIGIAKNEIVLEEKKTEFREKNSHNELVQSLHVQVESLKKSLEENTISNIETVTSLTEKNNNLVIEKQSSQNIHSEKITELNLELINERNKVNQLNQRIAESSKDYYNNKNLVKDLESKLSLEKFRNERLKSPINKIVKVGNHEVFEYFNIVKDIMYFDLKDKKFIPISEFKTFLDGATYTTQTTSVNVNSALNEMSQIMSDDERAKIRR